MTRGPRWAQRWQEEALQCIRLCTVRLNNLPQEPANTSNTDCKAIAEKVTLLPPQEDLFAKAIRPLTTDQGPTSQLSTPRPRKLTPASCGTPHPPVARVPPTACTEHPPPHPASTICTEPPAMEDGEIADPPRASLTQTKTYREHKYLKYGKGAPGPPYCCSSPSSHP